MTNVGRGNKPSAAFIFVELFTQILMLKYILCHQGLAKRGWFKCEEHNCFIKQSFSRFIPLGLSSVLAWNETINLDSEMLVLCTNILLLHTSPIQRVSGKQQTASLPAVQYCIVLYRPRRYLKQQTGKHCTRILEVSLHYLTLREQRH